jgi:hypothetical protein
MASVYNYEIDDEIDEKRYSPEFSEKDLFLSASCE